MEQPEGVSMEAGQVGSDPAAALVQRPEGRGCAGRRAPTKRCAAISAACALVLLLALGLVGVLMRSAIATRTVNSSTIEFVSLSATEPWESTGANGVTTGGFQMQSTMHISGTGPISATLQATTAELHYDDVPAGTATLMGMVPMPEVHAEAGKTAVVQIDTRFTAHSLDTLIAFNTGLINKEKVQVRIRAKLSLKVMGLTAVAHMDKTVSMRGMHRLGRVMVTDYDMPGDVNETANMGTYCKIAALVHNPSVASMSLGTLHFDLMYGGSYVGSVSGENLSLVPGANNVTFTGIILPKDLDSASEMFSLYMAGNSSSSLSVGRNVTPHVGWVERTVQHMEMNVVLPGYDAAAKGPIIWAMSADQLGMKILGQDGSGTCSGNLTAQMSSPFPFSYKVTGMKADIVAAPYANASGGLRQTTQWLATDFSRGSARNGTVRAVFGLHANGSKDASSEGSLVVVDQASAEVTLSNLLNEYSSAIYVSGTCSAKMSTRMGDLTLTGIPVSNIRVDIPRALNGFNNDPRVATSAQINLVDANASAVVIELNASIPNPSMLSIGVKSLVSKATYNGVYLGKIVMNDVELKPNAMNVVKSTLYGVPQSETVPSSCASPPCQPAITTLFNRYASNLDTAITIEGDPDDPSTVPVLRPSMKQLRIQSTMTGLSSEQPLVLYALMKPSLNVDDAKGQLFVKNPWASPMTVTGVSGELFVQDNEGQFTNLLGVVPKQYWDGKDGRPEPKHVAPYSSDWSHQFRVKAGVCLSSIQAVMGCAHVYPAITSYVNLLTITVIDVDFGDGPTSYRLDGLGWNTTNCPGSLRGCGKQGPWCDVPAPSLLSEMEDLNGTALLV